jgi:hypothetical protein
VAGLLALAVFAVLTRSSWPVLTAIVGLGLITTIRSRQTAAGQAPS